MAFAVQQISQEYPAVAKERVAIAVSSATPFVALAEGRVQLMRRAREFLHPPK
jgi:hypothetical protein